MTALGLTETKLREIQSHQYPEPENTDHLFISWDTRKYWNKKISDKTIEVLLSNGTDANLYDILYDESGSAYNSSCIIFFCFCFYCNFYFFAKIDIEGFFFFIFFYFIFFFLWVFLLGFKKAIFVTG
eukprot:1152449_1